MAQFSDPVVHVKWKLAALWTSTMLCYIYCDYFELYVPGKLDGMLQGRIAPLGTATQGMLLGTSLMMAVPSLMVFLSLVLPARYSRILNIVFGTFFALLLALFVYASPWYFYKLFAGIEAGLSALAIWYAWNWPRVEQA